MTKREIFHTHPQIFLQENKIEGGKKFLIVKQEDFYQDSSIGVKKSSKASFLKIPCVQPTLQQQNLDTQHKIQQDNLT